MNHLNWLFVAAFLIAYGLIAFAMFWTARNAGKKSKVVDPEAAKAAEAAKRLFAAQAGLTFSSLFLAERIGRMRERANSLDAPVDDPLSELGREKRIILEQIRIAASHSLEIKVALLEFDASTPEAVRWPFTAANLQLSFAQKRLDRWPNLGGA